MQFKNLPAKNAKEEANVVSIKNRKMKTDNPEGVDFEIPAERFVYPQVETLEEAEQICGTKENFLETFNAHLRDSAIAEAKNSIRMATAGESDAIIDAGILKGKNFTFTNEGKLTAAEAKEKFSELRNIAAEGNLSDEEFAAKVKAMLGL